MRFLARIGSKLFGHRLYLGLAVAVVGCELLTPRPFMDDSHRLGQLISMGLLAIGIWLRSWASGCAGGHTRDIRIKAPTLVTTGPYGHVRNPIYLGTLFIGVGMSGLIGDPLAFALTGIALGVLYVGIIPAEEEFLRNQFGTEYGHYERAVPRIIPRLRPWRKAKGDFDWHAVRGEGGIVLILAAIYAGLHFEEYLDGLFWWA